MSEGELSYGPERAGNVKPGTVFRRSVNAALDPIPAPARPVAGAGGSRSFTSVRGKRSRADHMYSVGVL